MTNHSKYFSTLYASGIKQRLSNLAPQLTALDELLQIRPLRSQIELAFVPNLLQLRFIADYAYADQTLYVISGTFTYSAIIHEYLHILLKPLRPILLDALKKHPLNQYADIPKMQKLGYLWGNSNMQQTHTLEECVVRALCGIMDHSLNLKQYSQNNTENGFTSVPEMINAFASLSWKDMDLGDLVLCAVNICK